MDDFNIGDDDEIEVVYLDEVLEGEEDEEYFDEEPIDEDNENLPVNDLARLTFSKHTRSVFACDLSKDGTMALTGGQDDIAYLWNTSNGEVIMEFTGHKDSVTQVQFNHDNQLIVTGDMGGLIQVWNVKDKKLTWCYEGDDLEWVYWHDATNILISGAQSGDIYVFQIPQGNCKVLPSHGASASASKLLPDGKQLLVGYSDGVLKLWDIKSASSVWQLIDLNISSINSLDINSEGTMACLSPTAHIIKLADGRVASKVLADGDTEIETCAFNAELGILATGALTGQICVWEVGRQALRHQAQVESSVSITKFGTNGRLLIGAADGAIYVCNARTGLLIETLTGHHYCILDLCISKCGNFVLSTSDDNTAKIFTLKEVE